MSSNVPPTAYKPGTVLAVGSHKVVINKYLSQGGFAHVYTCIIEPKWRNEPLVCLKRVAVPDKPTLNILRQEVDAMRRLEGKSCIVSYIDSHAARMTTGVGYEVFVLMEYCSRNGLIDFMNQRLVNKLTETEILQIMGEITEGVAQMHALNPVLVHKDIKIENVLISGDGHYKLCDFGSASPPLRPPRNVEEFQILQDDIMKHTTPQYRSPEMIDLYRKQPIDEKSDIWALGVFLYKLCYYTTPFEHNSINGNGNAGGGEYAILNGIYKCPSTPPYSARLKNVIAKLLVVNPQGRPTVFQLLDEICKIRGVPYPGIYPAQVKSAPHSQSVPIPAKSNHHQAPIASTPALPSAAPYKDSSYKPTLPVRRDKTTGDIKSSRIPDDNALHKSTSERYISTIHNNDTELIEADPFSSINRSKVLGFHQNTNKSSTDLNRKSIGHNKDSFLKPVMMNHQSTRSSSSGNSTIDARPGISSRPISMSATEFNKLNLHRSGAASPIDNMISNMTQEEVLELSPNHHTNIESSIDFLKNLSRIDTHQQQRTGDSIKSRMNFKSSNAGKDNTSFHNKRSSISSLKDLLTGGRSRDSSRHASYNSRVASGNSQTFSKSTDSLHEFASISKVTSSDTLSLSPQSSTSSAEYESREIKLEPTYSSHSHSSKPNLPTHRPPKRSNSIQRRVQMLLNRKQSPPPSKTASGYGKYTETANTSSNGISTTSDMPPPQSKKINKLPLLVTTNASSTTLTASQYRTPSPSPILNSNHSIDSTQLTPSTTSSSYKDQNIFKTPSHQSNRLGISISNDGTTTTNSYSDTESSTMSTPLREHVNRVSRIIENNQNGNGSSNQQLVKKRPKAPPPPKPKKPVYLKSPNASKISNVSPNGEISGMNGLIDRNSKPRLLVPEHARKISDAGSEFDDIESLERRFNEKFPSAL